MGASVTDYNDGSCGYTSYEEDYRCWHNEYDGTHCENEYGGYYNDYVGATTDGYETNYPPTDDDSGPTSREGGRGYREEDGMCGIAKHTPTMATVLKGKLREEEKKMKLALVTKKLEGVTEEVIKAAE